MALVDVLRGLTKGVAGAAGNEDAVRDLTLQQQQARQRQDQQHQLDLKTQLAPLTQASAGLQKQIIDLTDPNTGKPYAGSEGHHAQLVNQLSDVIGKTRMILHPPPPEDPHGLGYLAHRATDALHITNDAAQKAREVQSQRVNDYQTQLHNAALNEANQLAAANGGNPLTPEQQTQGAQIHAGITPKAIAPKPPTESADTRARADYDAYYSDPAHQSETKLPFLEWKNRVSTKGRNYDKPYAFDAKTGQVVDPVTGTRYTYGEDNPAEVQKMFQSEQATQKRTQDFQQKLAQIRANAYSVARWNQPLQVLDAANGNQPAYATFNEMRDNPGRFIPASSGAKALSQENFLQEINRLSSQTRNSINKIPDFDDEMRGKLAFALKSEDPGVLRTLLASNAIGSLTPEQQDFLIDVAQLHEQALGLRTTLGTGQGAQDVRNAIRSTLPGVLSPDKGYALRQLDAFDATLNQLHKGVPNVQLNQGASFNNEPGQTPKGPKTKQLQGMQSGSSQPAYIYARDPQGNLHRAKPGTKLPQGWTLTNGPR